ncbi:MAG: porin [Planctomycetaceae bacterium]|jgi:hypothetical protein|nr:porin [Planctomycetaceae bacterium]
MKKIFISLCTVAIFALAILTNPSLSQSTECAVPCEPVKSDLDLLACEPCEPIGCSPLETEICEADKFFGAFKKDHRLILSNSNFEVTGWIQGGFFANAHGTTTKRTKINNYDNRAVNQFDADSGNGYFFGNTHSTDFQINQIWIELTKEADGKHGLDWGFSTGVLFGTDAWFTQSFSDAKFDYGWQSGDYFTSIPSLYFQLAYGDLSLKVGKFETYIGYESLRAPDAIFYSHPYSFMFEPSTHSGLLAEYTPTDKLQIVLAYTTGADASLENAYDDHGFLGSVSYQFTDKLNLTYSMMYQEYGGGVYKNNDRHNFENSNQFFHTFLASYDLSERLTYVLQWTYVDVKNRLEFSHERSKGIGNYLKYKLNKFWSVGFRAEWFATEGIDYSEYTLGLTWQPDESFIVRPEIRFDHASDKINKPFNYGNDRDQFSGGITGVYVF